MSRLDFSASLDDAKLVYRVLHAHLQEHVELMDSDLLDELQRRLQAAARAEGIDVADHGAWDRWLGNSAAPSCGDRLEGRRVLA
jgi:hypothetical protein